MSPSKILLSRFALEALLSSTPSASGQQIESLRNGTQPNRDGWRADPLARKREQYADLLLLCKDLNPDEERVCRLRYGSAAGVESYERLVTLSDLADAEKYQGEVMIPGRAGQVVGNVELRKVVGVRARLPGFQEIAEGMNGAAGHTQTTPRQVKRWLEGAREKVAVAMKWRRFNQAIEERYE